MFIDEVRQLLEDEDVATGGVDFFNSSLASVPKGAGPYLLIRETSGPGPDKIHNQLRPPAYVRPQAQLMSIAEDPVLARRMIDAAYRVLCARTNEFLGTRTVSVTSLTREGTVATAVTEEPHQWGTGYLIEIAGSDQAEYLDTFEITVVDETTFTFTVMGSPTTPATGTITAAYAGTWYRSISAIQDPFGMSLDSDDRTRFAFNIRADKVFS